MLTSIVAAVQALRSHPEGKALLSGMSMWMAKHCYAVYSSSPPGYQVRTADSATAQRQYDALPQRRICSGYTGPAKIATYTIMYDRSGQRSRGVLICDIPSGERCYAIVEDEGLLKRLEHEECVGLPVALAEGSPLPIAAITDVNANAI